MAYTDITPKPYNLYNNNIGDDWKIPIPVKQADRVTAWDFTGWQGFAQVRDKIGGNIIATFDTYDGSMSFDGGTIYLVSFKDVTAQLSPGLFIWESQFLEPVTGLTRTLITRSVFEITGDGAK